MSDLSGSFRQGDLAAVSLRQVLANRMLGGLAALVQRPAAAAQRRNLS
jgi:hypothetical protein